MSNPMEITVTLQEHEARLLSQINLAVQPFLSEAQLAIAGDIAQKFFDASQKGIQELIEERGDAGALAFADQALAAHPEADGPIVIPGAPEP